MSHGAVKARGYSFYLVNIDCLPNSDHFNVVMEMDESVEELLPYLAASLAGCTYIHGTDVVSVMDAGHIVAIYPRRITITDVGGGKEAETLCRSYFQKIEEVKSKREAITPVYQKRTSLSVLDIFRSLPKTNCGLCLSPTCLAFAAKVFRRECSIASCEPVREKPEKYGDLFHKLQSNGYEIP